LYKFSMTARRTKVQFGVLRESQKARFSRMFSFAAVSTSPCVSKFVLENHEFLGKYCGFLKSQKISVEMEGKIWTFRARFARENRVFVPLNFPVIAPRRFWAILKPSFRSAIAAPNAFVNCARTRRKFSVFSFCGGMSRVAEFKFFIKIGWEIFSLSFRSQSRRGDERAGVRVPGSHFVASDAIYVYLYTLRIRS
jgi:hypothetical protein